MSWRNIQQAPENPGFFLIEAIAALLICLAVGGSFILAFRELQPIRLKFENAVLLSQLRWLTVLAQECQKPLLLELKEDGYRAFFKESPESILFQRSLPARITIHGETSNLAFYPSQAVSPVSLELRDEGGTRCHIVLSLRGRVRSDC